MAELKKKRKVKVTKPTEKIACGTEVTDTLKRKWRFGEEFGSGGCGVIYDGFSDSSAAPHYVIKVEYQQNGPLFTELHVYHSIDKPDAINAFSRSKKINFLGIPRCHGSGSFDYDGKRYRFMVFEKYGKDLQSVLDANKNKLHPKTVFIVGSIVINVLDYIQRQGYAHCDIKAANLLLGRTPDTQNNVYLIDMGLATRFLTRSGEVKNNKPNPGKANNGTPEFISRDGHVGVISRRSDIETLSYNMLLWLSGTLPWMNVLSDPTKLRLQKEKYMGNVELLMDTLLPHSNYPEFVQFLTSVSKLQIEDTPNYDSYLNLFKRLLVRLKYSDGVLILKNPSKGAAEKGDTSTESDLSQKENNGKKAARKKRAPEDSSSSVLPSGEVLTPAMLAVINRQQEKAAEKATKKPRRKAQ